MYGGNRGGSLQGDQLRILPSGQISVSEKAGKCMENEKVLRLRISSEKCGPKSKFGPGNSVDNRLSFPAHPGSTSGSKKCMHQLAARAGRILGWVQRPRGCTLLSRAARPDQPFRHWI